MASGRIEAKDIFDVDGIISAASDISNALEGINNLVKGEAGKLKIEIGSTADMQKLSEIAKSIEALADVHKRAADFADAHATAVTNLAATLNGATKPAAGANQALRQLGLSLQQLDKIANTTNRQSIVSLAQNLQTLTKDIKANEAAIVSEMEKIDASKMTYNELSATLSVLKEAVKSVSTAELEESAAGQKMTSVAKSLNDQLAATDAKMGGYKRNVGNYASAFDGLGFSIRQVVRETPSLGIGFNQYFLAISNNIPMLIDEWKRYGQTMRETNRKIEEGIIQGQKMEGTWKHALRSVVSWQTAVIGLLTVLSSKNIQNWFIGLFKKVEDVVTSIISKIKAAASVLSGYLTDFYSANAELRLLRRSIDGLTVGTDEWRETVQRINKLTGENLDYLTATKDAVKSITDEYLRQQRILEMNKNVVKQLADSDVNRAKRSAVSRSVSADFTASVLGFDKDSDEYKEIEKGLKKLIKEANFYGKLDSLPTLINQAMNDKNNGANFPINRDIAKALSSYVETIKKLTPVLSDEAQAAIEAFYQALENEDEERRKKRVKQEKVDYTDLWKEMMQERYKAVTDEYKRELSKEQDAYHLYLTELKAEYQSKQEDLKKKADLEKWSADKLSDEMIALSSQYDAIIIAKKQEYYDTLAKIGNDYTKKVEELISEETEVFINAEKEKTKSAEKHISRRNKTIADNFQRNTQLMNAALAYQEQIYKLEEQKEKNKKRAEKEAMDYQEKMLEEMTRLEARRAELEKEEVISNQDPTRVLTEYEMRLVEEHKVVSDTLDKIGSEVKRVTDDIVNSAEEANKGIDTQIQTATDNLQRRVSEIDLTKEFKRKGYDQQIVEAIFGLNNAGGQEKYILDYYTRMAEKVAAATGQKLSVVMAAYAAQLNAKYGTNVKVDEGKFIAGEGDNRKFGAMWSDFFNDKFWDEFSEYKDALSDMASATWDYVDEMIDAWVELANAKAEAAAEVTENAKTEYEKEKSLMDAGYANQMETAWKVYNEKKEIQEQAEREAKEAAALQQKLDTATQISSLITAAAKIFESMSSAGVIGVALAAAGVAAMIASFIGSKSMARQAAQYGEGHVEYIGYGGSHASGNDNPLAVDAQGRERKIERGEVFGVIKGRSVRKYGLGNVMSLLSAVNDGTYQMGEDTNRRNYAIGFLPARGNNFPSLATIEGSLASIDNKVGRTSYVEADGTRVAIDGNNVVRTRRIA